MLDLDFHQLTDPGCSRPANEDAVGHWPRDDGLVFAVADGLGGHEAGEVASALAVETLAERLAEPVAAAGLPRHLRRAVQDANLAIYQKSLAVPELRGMATTLTVTAVVGATLIGVHVGDCRLLLIRDGSVTQLTKDHTWVAEQVQYGLLSAAAAATHPKRHALTRCLGAELIVGIDVLRLDLRPGDVLVQCSDGAHGVLDERAIGALVIDRPARDGCEAVLARALDAGAPDNVSIQVAAVRDCPAPSRAPRSWWRLGR